MPELPRRKRLQIHLSTAIVLMFAAGGITWANVRREKVETNGVVPFADKGIPATEANFLRRDVEGLWKGERQFLHLVWEGEREYSYGWPRDAMKSETFVRVRTSGEATVYRTKWDSHAGAIVANAVVALGILFTLWFFCEWLIRRRAARKAP